MRYFPTEAEWRAILSEIGPRRTPPSGWSGYHAFIEGRYWE